MPNRRNFIKKATIGSIGVSTVLNPINASAISQEKAIINSKTVKKPLIISTWRHGLAANEEAWKQLKKGAPALEAITAGVGVSEADPEVRSVGYGGLPDREGKVTLDACIMDANSDCGSVSFLQGIKHPIAVAKKILEKKKQWKKWLENSKYKPVINIENHDTISMLVLDKEGNIYGGCTTSGAAWKMHGRVGDSPIIGAGLFLDNEVGAAAATGLGEAVIRTAGSAMVVELMRQGKSPKDACKEIVERIYKKHVNHKDLAYLQVGFIAINKQGEYGGYSLRPGFNYAVYDEENENRMEKSAFIMKKN